MKGFKFVETMEVTFIKRKGDKNIHKPAYFNSRTQVTLMSFMRIYKHLSNKY